MGCELSLIGSSLHAALQTLLQVLLSQVPLPVPSLSHLGQLLLPADVESIISGRGMAASCSHVGAIQKSSVAISDPKQPRHFGKFPEYHWLQGLLSSRSNTSMPPPLQGWVFVGCGFAAFEG